MGINLPSLTDQKADLRKRCYDKRIRIEDEKAEAAALAVAERVSASVEVTTSSIVSAYWPLPGEVDPRPALLALGNRGATLALPRTVGDGQPLDFHAWKPDNPLIEGRFKVMEPAPSAAIVAPSILLVPLLAFDQDCHRLGHGKGYYDRTLQRLRTDDLATRAIGVAFEAQKVDRVPTDEFDQTLDLVITEKTVYRPA